MSSSRIAGVRFAVLLAWICIAGHASGADSYPARPIRYIVASAPGGIADITARVIAPSLARALGHPVVVENRTSGGITVGSELVAKASPDGHTLLSVTPQLAIAPTLNRNFPFDPRKDLAAVAL